MAPKIVVLALIIFVAIVGMASVKAEGDAKKYGNDHIGTNEAAGEVAAPGEAVAAPVAEPEDMPASLTSTKASADDSHHSGASAIQVSAFAGAGAAAIAALLF